jgi:hypothetical protein
LEAAAEARLSRDLRSEFATLLTSLRKRGRERNKVVHGLWGVSPQMPDVLINCPPENFIRDIKNTYIMGWLIGEKHEPSNDFVRGLMAYSNKDFIDIITRSYELQQQLTAFTNKVGKNAAEQLALIRALERQPESP